MLAAIMPYLSDNVLRRRIPFEQWTLVKNRFSFEKNPSLFSDSNWSSAVMVMQEDDLFLITVPSPIGPDNAHDYLECEGNRCSVNYPFKDVTVFKYDRHGIESADHVVHDFKVVDQLSVDNIDYPPTNRNNIVELFRGQECDPAILQRLWMINGSARSGGDLNRFNNYHPSWKIKSDDRFPKGWFVATGNLSLVLCTPWTPS